MEIKIDDELYTKLRTHCDKENIRFKEFVGDTLEEAIAPKPNTYLKTEQAEQKGNISLKDAVIYTKSEFKKILKQAAIQAEKAYRRGFYQGFCSVAHQKKMSRIIPNLDKLHQWRYRSSLKKAYFPPWIHKGSHNIIHRHFIVELQSDPSNEDQYFYLQDAVLKCFDTKTMWMDYYISGFYLSNEEERLETIFKKEEYKKYLNA